jgi:integrase
MTSRQFCIFKRGPIFYLQFTNEDGLKKQISTGCRSKADAYKFFAEFEEKQVSAKCQQLISNFIDDFVIYAKNIYSPSTVRCYKSAAVSLQKYLGDIPIQSITTLQLEQFKAYRLNQIRPHSVNIELRSIKALFSLMTKWDLIKENPSKKVSCLRTPRNDPRYLTQDDCRHLISIIKEEWLIRFIQFAVFTGMRIGEICSLRWENVLFDRRIIHLRNSDTFTTKNKSERVIPISDGLFHLLNVLRMENSPGFVFIYNGKPMLPNFASKRFKKYVRMAGLSEEIHFHHLRSTFATWMLLQGVDIFVVSKLLGHSDVSVTAKHYASVRNDLLLKGVNTVSFLIE